MIQSMTGYGKSVATVKGKKIRVEIKSLNSKALDLSVRVAPAYREKEMEIRSMVSKALERGKVELNLTIEKEEEQAATPINGAIMEGYYHQIKAISAERNIPMPADLFATLLRLPDVMSRTETEELDEEEWAAARKAVEEAIAQLVEFRMQEGAALQKKFTEKINNISALLKSIEPYEQGRTERIRQRLLEALAAIPEAQYDQNRLEQEMIYYIEKLDINEEKQRLANHGKRTRTRQEARLHSPGNGARNQHHGQQEQPSGNAEHRGEDERRIGTNQRAGAQRHVTHIIWQAN